MVWLTIVLIMISIAILVIVGLIYKKKNKGCEKETYETDKVKLKMVAYNVLFGLWCRPESVGKMLRPYKFDIICLNEVPNNGWTEKVGKIVGLTYVYVGKSSSGNHKNKYKSILSKYPLYDNNETIIKSKGWHSSVVSSKIKIKGIPITIFSTHIPGHRKIKGSAADFIARKLVNKSEHLFILGDLNNRLQDGVLDCFENAGMKSNWKELGINVSKMSSSHDRYSGKDDGVIDHIFFKNSNTSTSTFIKATKGGIIQNAYNDPNIDLEMSENKKEWITFKKPMSDHKPVWTEFIIYNYKDF